MDDQHTELKPEEAYIDLNVISSCYIELELKLKFSARLSNSR